jgi:hypothetical protein
MPFQNKLAEVSFTFSSKGSCTGVSGVVGATFAERAHREQEGSWSCSVGSALLALWHVLPC